jgi:hypothetical protein
VRENTDRIRQHKVADIMFTQGVNIMKYNVRENIDGRHQQENVCT